jgi:sporulation protein YlmC with PRC-barrel domain
MLSNLLRTSALAAFLLTPSLASAQVTTSTSNKIAVGSQFRAKQVLGTKIMIQNNTAIGTVDDLVFDDAGNLDYLIVENGGKLVTVPWDAAKFDLDKRTAVLSITPDQYKVIPTYTVTTYSGGLRGLLGAPPQ